jgi:hypothetical protein
MKKIIILLFIFLIGCDYSIQKRKITSGVITELIQEYDYINSGQPFTYYVKIYNEGQYRLIHITEKEYHVLKCGMFINAENKFQ